MPESPNFNQRLKSVTSALKKQFAPEIQAIKEVMPAVKDASRQVLTEARDRTSKAISSFGENLVKDEGKGLSLLGNTAGLLALDVGLAALTNVISPAAPEYATRAAAVQTVFGLINGGIGTFTAKKALDFYNQMRK